MNTLTPHQMMLARQLAERHRIPETSIVHPEVLVHNRDGTVDTFMTAKLREPHYVPYCLNLLECGRLRRTEWGFKCPTCGNKANYDLTKYDGNQNVKYVGAPPVLSIKEWNAQVVARKHAKSLQKGFL